MVGAERTGRVARKSITGGGLAGGWSCWMKMGGAGSGFVAVRAMYGS